MGSDQRPQPGTQKQRHQHFGVTSLIQQYDTALNGAKSVDTRWWDLDKSLPPLMASAIDLGKKLSDLDDQLTKLQTKDQAAISPASLALEKLAADPKADPRTIQANLDTMADSGNDLVSGRSGLWSQMDKIAKQKLQIITKARDDYRTKIGAINKEWDDLQTRCDKYEAGMKSEITKYQVQLRKLDHAKVADDLDAFIDVLKGP